MSHAGGANSPPVKGEWRKAARGFDVQAGMVAGVSKLCSQSVTSG